MSKLVVTMGMAAALATLASVPAWATTTYYQYDLTLTQLYGTELGSPASDFTAISTPFTVADTNGTGTGTVDITVDGKAFTGTLTIHYNNGGPGPGFSSASGSLFDSADEEVSIGSVDPGSFNADVNVNGTYATQGGTAVLTATPLPAGLPLIAGGLGLVCLMAWRSRKSQGEDLFSSMASA